MEVVEAYEAKHSLPGVCVAGDVFLIYEDGAVYQISRMGMERASRVKLRRSSLRRLDGPPAADSSSPHPQDSHLKVVNE